MTDAERLARLSDHDCYLNSFAFRSFRDVADAVISPREWRIARSCRCSSFGPASRRACGAAQALEWADVDLQKNQLCVPRSEWKGQVGTTKGGQLRYVNMTTRLASALRNHRHLISPRVVCRADGRPVTQKIVQDHVRRAARLAKVTNEGVQVLRHTFCSHLAMKGAPAKAIQELAGHRDLSTTQRYLHLSPAARESAIRLLDQPCGANLATTG